MSPDRRTLVAAGLAVLVAAAVTAVILVFGYVPLPAFPSLADRPDPSIPGTVAFVRWDREPCVFTVPASGGEPHEVLCRSDHAFIQDPVAWTPDGRLLVHAYEEFGGPVVMVVDPVSGQELDRIGLDERTGPGRLFEADRARAEREDGARVLTARRDPVSVAVRLPDGETRVLFEVDRAPRDYAFFRGQWSPDGGWILVEDSHRRLVVMGADGEPGPQVLAVEASGAAWYVPGHDAYTIDPGELEEDDPGPG